VNSTDNSPNASNRSHRSGKATAELLDALLSKACIAEWDLLMVGDGSGTGWNEPNGWACVLIDRQTRLRKLFYGGSNAGSVNFAELMPYFQGLTWFHSQHGKRRLKERGFQRVHVITDSQVTALHGNRSANPREDLPSVPQRPLWAAVREQCRIGYQLQFHWAARMTNDLNYISDLVAGLTRRALIPLEDESAPDSIMQDALAVIDSIEFIDPKTGCEADIYGANPHGS